MMCDCNLDLVKQDITNPPMNCRATWQLIGEGNTKGIFQLESQLGKSLSKRLKPDNIEHLSALLSIMRPGCLEAIVDGKSMTDHYIDRKNNIEPVEYFHPSLEAILEPTLGILIYQESSIKIATDIAGMSLSDADFYIRKGIGKKKPEIIAEAKDLFLNGCKEQGIVSETDAESIFEWIKKGQRYIFNHSHAIAYAYNAYLTAYCKTHFPRQFFTSYLYHSKSKPDYHEEINELVSNMKVMGENVYPPNLAIGNDNFKLVKGKIYFGLTDIKGLGASVFNKIRKLLPEYEKLLGPLSKWSWTEFLIFFAPKVTKTAIECLINSGALHFMSSDRAWMAYEHKIYISLRAREQEWIKAQILAKKAPRNAPLAELLDILAHGPTGKNGGIYHKKRIPVVESLVKILKKPPYKILDSATNIARKEKDLLGIAITAHKLDDYDTSYGNSTCADIVKGFVPRKVVLACQIEAVREWKIKKGEAKGETMCFLAVSDQSCTLDSVAMFSETYREYRDLIFVGNLIAIIGFLGKKGLIIQKITQI